MMLISMLLINKRQHLNSKNHSDETLQIMESHPKEKILSFIIKNSKRLRNNRVKVSAIVKRENELFGNLTLTTNIEFKRFDSLSTFFYRNNARQIHWECRRTRVR